MSSGSSAGFGRRFAALLYDALLVAGVLLIFTTAAVFANHGALLPETSGLRAYLYRAVLLAMVAGYYVMNWTRSGATLGMRAWRLRAVLESGQRMRLGYALLRLPLAFFSWLPLGLGVLWLYVDPEHAAIQDRLSGTRVIHLER